MSTYERDDLPLHPTIRRWLGEYARSPDGRKDEVVGRMLTELNALLHHRYTAESGERDAPAARGPEPRAE